MSSFGRLAAVGCVLLLATACGGSSSSPTPTPVHTVPVPAGSTAVQQILPSATPQPVASPTAVPTLPVALPTAAAATPLPAGTTVVTYAPPAIDTSAAGDGNCWIESIATGGRQASYRCMEGNLIYDPCFSQPGLAGYVFCPGDPTIAADDLVLASDLSAVTFTSASPRAWFFVTADGLHCSALTGTVADTAIGLAPYACVNPDGSPGPACLDPVQQDPAWTATCATLGASTGSTHSIQTIWF